MKKMAILLALTMVLALAVPTFAAGEISYSFDDGVIPAEWQQHWGIRDFEVVDGALFTERTTRNAFYGTGCKISGLTAGTYTVSADIWYDDAEYGSSVPMFVGITSGSFDGDAYAKLSKSVEVNEVATFTFEVTFTGEEDLANVWFTTKQDSWNPIGVDYYIDNVSIVEVVSEYPEIVLPEGYGDETACTHTSTMDPAVIFNYDDGGAYVYCDLYNVADASKVQVKVYSYDEVLTTLTWTGDMSELYAAEVVLAVGDGSTKNNSAFLADTKWSATEWAAQDFAPITKLELWVNDVLCDLTTDIRWTHIDKEAPADAAVALDGELWVNTNGTLTEEEYKDYLASLKANSSGYISTGDETHMIIINGAVITTAHEFVDGVCVYCYHVDTTADDETIIEIVDPVEPSTEEEEDDTVPAEPTEEPEEDTNPETGLALALVPMMLAAVAVVAKKR